MLEDVKWLGHASFLITRAGKNVYFDPWQLPPALPQADVILISHDHYDHCSPTDVQKIQKAETVVVAPPDSATKLGGLVVPARPGEEKDVAGLRVRVLPAYNVNSDFHPKDKAWVGYVVDFDGYRVYFAGDTDLIPEMRGIRPDLLLLPVGGKYTMDAAEAAQAVEAIEPKVVVPMHYGTIIGSEADARRLAQLVMGAQVEILEPLKRAA